MLFSLLFNKLKELIPPENGLLDDFYGLQYGSLLRNYNIHKIVLCLEPTKEIIIKAISLKANLIISHHGLITKPIISINDSLLDQIKLFE